MTAYIKNNATKLIFMAAVFSFLAVSVPKVASVFHLYEPQASGQLDGMWWVTAVLAAAGIDILAGYLTLVMMNKEARKRDKVLIWAFIIALMAYSWYCNWLFDMLNNPATGTSVWDLPLINLPWVGQWTVGQLTPIIVGGLPVFVVAYAAIAHLVHVKNAPISLEELQQRAAEAQARAAAQVAIIQAQNMVNEQKVVGVIGVGKKVLKNVVNAGEKEAPSTVNTRLESEDKTTDKTPAITEENAANNEAVIVAFEPSKTSSEDAPSARTTSPLSVSFKEASLMLGLSESYIRELRNKGKLRSPARNNKLVTTKSINEFIKTRETPGQNGNHNGYQNVHKDETIIDELVPLTLEIDSR